MGAVWPEWRFLSRQRLFIVRHGLELPLERLAFLDGDGGFGRTATYFLPCAYGVFVGRRGVACLLQPDLSREIWRRETQGWITGPVFDGRAFTAFDDYGERVAFELETGGVSRRRAFEGLGLLMSLTTSTRLIRIFDREGKNPRLVSLDSDSLEQLWEARWSGSATGTDERYLIEDELATVLYCADARTGRVVWRFEFATVDERAAMRAGKARPVSIVQGYPSVVTPGDGRVIVILTDGHVCSLDLETGKLLAKARPPFLGIHLVTDASIFYLQPFGLSEFDHRTMKEVSRIEYRREVEPLYGKRAPLLAAFWITHESVIWTNVDGTLMGVSRQASANGRRKVWTDKPHPKAGTGFADFPLAYGDYFYFADMGDNLGLYCYRSAAGRSEPLAANGKTENKGVSSRQKPSKGKRRRPA
jgi:hypothetical protein